MELMNLDKTKVKEITNASRTATVAMIALGLRKRSLSYTNLSAIKNQLLEMNEKIANRDYMDFWRGLEDAGAGSIILGRRGKQTRFEWNYSLKQIAQFAIEGKDKEIEKMALKKKIPSLPKPEALELADWKDLARNKKNLQIQINPGEPSRDMRPKKMEVLVYTVPIRANYSVQVSLPADITEKELQNFSNSFRSIPEISN